MKSIIIVILMEMEKPMFVKFTSALLSLKTTGEMNIAQVIHTSIVTVHSLLLPVKVLGLVMISIILLLMS